MDEPTSAISEHEIEVLFRIIEDLKRQGVAIAYITHKLEELTRIADDAVVMRDGRVVGAAQMKDLDHDAIVQMMVGREMKGLSTKRTTALGDEAIRVDNLSLVRPERPDNFLLEDINFQVHRGEVLGIFGLMGAGRTELLETVFGLHPDDSTGEVFVKGQRERIDSPKDAIALGLALAPEDRRREGLVLEMTVAENASLACLERLERFGFVDEAAEHSIVEQSIERFRVKTPSQKQLIRNLSGGNQQKVILGKWLATEPLVLLLDEPTRGIDVHAKGEIYSLINELATDGLAVIVVSSELSEILVLSDRILVLCEGRKTAEFDRTEANEESIMSAALPKTA